MTGMAAIPDFQADGLLPLGDYEVSFAELTRIIHDGAAQGFAA